MMTISVNSGLFGGEIRDTYETSLYGTVRTYEVPIVWGQPNVKGQWLNGGGSPTRRRLVILADGRKALYYCGSPESLATLEVVEETEWTRRYDARRKHDPYCDKGWELPKEANP